MSRVASLFVAMLVMMISSPAWAHTAFEYSEPAADAEVPEPVSEVIIGFTLPVTLVGNGFEVLDPDGEIHQPAVETSDDRVFRLILTEPLLVGVAGVRYEVIAEDGHVLAGGFSFTVAGAAVTTTLPSSTTTVTIVTTTTTSVDTTTTVDPEPQPGSMTPWLIGGGLIAVGAFGVFAALRSRSSR